MGKTMKILALGALLALGLPLFSVAQTTGGSTPGDFPQPIVVPYQDLDIYEQSTINSRFGEYRDTSSTLGKRQQRRSNVELNKPTEREEEAEEEALPAAPERAAPYEAPAGPAAESKPGDFYRWVDEDGTVHITNNISLVPREQQIEQGLLESAEGGEGGKARPKGAPNR